MRAPGTLLLTATPRTEPVIHVSHLSLTHFRNYATLEMDLPSGLVLLTGANAQGKTNLLEALFVLATGHSHHADTDREMVGWSAAHDPIPYARVASKVVSARRGDTDLELVMQIARRSAREDDLSGELPPPWSPEESPGPSGLAGGVLQKAFKVNGVRQRMASAPGVLAVVLAGPEEVDLVGGPPAGRRRFLDLALAQTDPAYFQALQHNQRVLSQRNALLRQARDQGTGRPPDMDVWDAELARGGSYVLWKRSATLPPLADEIRAVHASLASHTRPLMLDYRCTIGEIAPGTPRDLIREQFLAALQRSWPRDLATGMTSVGPHRDDLRLFSHDVDLGIYGSRGQQRTAALALILAQASSMRAALGEEPVLLLDDPLSELDSARRARLLAHCLTPERQTLLTTAEPELVPLDIHARSTVLTVSSGRVLPDGPNAG